MSLLALLESTISFDLPGSNDWGMALEDFKRWKNNVTASTMALFDRISRSSIVCVICISCLWVEIVAAKSNIFLLKSQVLFCSHYVLSPKILMVKNTGITLYGLSTFTYWPPPSSLSICSQDGPAGSTGFSIDFVRSWLSVAPSLSEKSSFLRIYGGNTVAAVCYAAHIGGMFSACTVVPLGHVAALRNAYTLMCCSLTR